MSFLPITEQHPIGAIARELEKSLARGDPQPTSEQAGVLKEVYRSFDTENENRPDYRLWRCAGPPYFAVRKPWLACGQTVFSVERGDWTAFASLCAESDDPVVLWSALALAPELIRARLQDGDIGHRAPIWRWASRLYGRLRFELEPLLSCPASCGLSALLFLVRHQQLHHRAGYGFGVSECGDFLKEIRRWASVIDGNWSPGKKINTDRIEEEGRSDARLRVGHSAFEHGVLVDTLALLRPIVSMSIKQLDDTAEGLLKDAYHYALTAWLMARSRRLWEIVFQKRRGWNNERARETRRRSFHVEFRCLLNLSNAARDAGEYLEAAKLLYLIFRLIPDEFVNDPLVRREVARRSLVFRYLKEAGLEVDLRFHRLILPSLETSGDRAKEGGLEEVSDFDDDRSIVGHSSDMPSPQTWYDARKTGFYLIVERDQSRDFLWRSVLAEIPKDELQTAADIYSPLLRA